MTTSIDCEYLCPHCTEMHPLALPLDYCPALLAERDAQADARLTQSQTDVLLAESEDLALAALEEGIRMTTWETILARHNQRLATALRHEVQEHDVYKRPMSTS